MSPRGGSGILDRYLRRKRVCSARGPGQRGHRRGCLSSPCFLLWLPDEILLEIIKFLPILQVSRISQVCTRLRDIVGPDVWSRGVLVPLADNCVSLLQHPNFERIGSLILTGLGDGALQFSLDQILSGWLSNLKFVMISVSCHKGLDVCKMAGVASEMECIQLEGGSLSADDVKEFFIAIQAWHSINSLLIVEQRWMSLVPVGTLVSVAGSMLEISLPYFGSTVDGISTSQFLGILLNPGKLEMLRLVSFWDVRASTECFDVAGLVFNLAEQRREILNEAWRGAAIREQCAVENDAEFPQSGLQVQHVCFIRCREPRGEATHGGCGLFALDYTIGGSILSPGDMMAQMEALHVPSLVSIGLAEMCWSGVCSAQATRLGWIMPFVKQDIRMVPSLSPSEDVWNISYLGNFVHHVLPQA